MKTVASALLLFTLFVIGVDGAVVPIKSTQVGTSQVVKVKSFTDKICVTGIGCGGSFDADIGTTPNKVTNATIWCVDSQIYSFPAGTNYTAYIQSLSLPAATFNNGNLVRYGSISTGPSAPAPSNSPAGANWLYSLSGLTGGVDPNSALTRYKLAAILIAQYTPTRDSPANTLANQQIQTAIWRLTENDLYGAVSPVGRLDDGPTVTGGTYSPSYWINYAITQLNLGTTYGASFFKKWAVVSGGFDTVLGKLDGTKGQTFLVQVVPEPQFVALALVGLLGVVLWAKKRYRPLATALPESGGTETVL